MTRFLAIALAASLALPGGAALAKGPKGCPPGLAKKDPACVPPGQAKKGVRYDDRYRDDDRHEREDRRHRGDRDEHDDDRYGDRRGDRYEDRHDDRYDDRYDDRDDWYGDRYDPLRTGDRVVMDGREYEVVRIGDRVILRREDDLYRLPRTGEGSDYVRMGDVIVKVDRKTKAAIQIIRLADLILG